MSRSPAVLLEIDREAWANVLLLLQNEMIAHAATTTKLMEFQDKLEFALGEIEVLRKQIDREKRQFEET